MSAELSTLNPQPSTIFDLAARLEENYKKLTTILENLGGDGPELSTLNSQPSTTQAQIAIMAEIRKHIALAEKALKTAVEVHAIEEFKQVVLNALAQASPTFQRRVRQILAARGQT